MDRLLQNVRIGIRSLRRSSGFTLTAILALAVGIGLATAVFTVADTVLLRRLPVREQDRLVVLWGETPDRHTTNFPVSLGDARTFARQSRSLEDAAFVAYEGATQQPIIDADRMSRLRRSLVSGNYFDVLGARPILGRALRPEDDVNGAAPVLVLSHIAWQRQFGGDSAVVGQRIVMQENNRAYTIVGVMPAGLDYPRGTDLWGPLVPAKIKPGTDSIEFADVTVIGRLRPDASPANARDELSAFFHRPGVSFSRLNLHGVVTPLPRLIQGDLRPAVIAFAAAVALLLLITCIDVANLLLVRGLARVREIAVRSALGGARGQVISLLLTENMILALLGGALGVVVAAVAVRSFVAFAPPGLPRLDEVHVSSGALAGAIAITGVAMLLFGLAPAIMTSRVELEQVLRADTRHSASRYSRRATEALVTGQVALAVLVLAAAGLITRSLLKLEDANLSFEPSHLLIGELAIRYDLLDTKEKQVAFLERMLPALQAVPGIRSVSPVVAVPYAGTSGWDGRPAAEGQSKEEAAKDPYLNMDVVTPSYFATMGTPLLRGRAFTDGDREGAPVAIILSEAAARYYWPNADPIGKRLGFSPSHGPWWTVVGIVPDARYRDLRDARPSIYFPLQQSFFPFVPTALVVRTIGEPGAIIPAMRRVIGAIDPGVALVSAAPFETFLDRPLAQPRLNALLLFVFAGAALVLAAVGLFGVMATMVRQRTRELGLRMALGATATDVRRLVMIRGLSISATGLVIGLLAAMAANRFLAGMLYGVTPTDGVTLALVGATLLAVALIASAIPARSSTRIDPAIALRAEG